MNPFLLRTLLSSALLLAATSATANQCPAPPVCPVCPVCPSADPTPVPAAKPLQAGAWSELPGWSSDRHAEVWPALLRSCSVLGRRAGWGEVCDAANELGQSPSNRRVRNFLEKHFTPWRAVNPDSSREGMVTGYYEPVITGSRTPSAQHRWPVHAPPADMISVDLAGQQPDLRHMRLRGRLVGNRLVPYWTRGEIAAMGEAFPARVLFWASDAIDLFFLQVQGSGQMELDDGSRVRIGYADQNGHPYASIGRWLVERGELELDKASMQGIRQWAQDNPQRLNELLHANPSYVFFRELPPNNDGPVGALGVPLTAGRSIASDPRFIPLGAPVFLDTTHPLSDRPLQRVMMAQDTGSAIRGAVRADFYWGTGREAGEQAGRMRQQGRMWVLLPKGMQPEQ
ncbi:MAG: MltA domain-containing protein [Pseudazoarcus pumilus]|nr:MltA domain-containing protein [Pseudazoarcus pumilus]